MKSKIKMKSKTKKRGGVKWFKLPKWLTRRRHDNYTRNQEIQNIINNPIYHRQGNTNIEEQEFTTYPRSSYMNKMNDKCGDPENLKNSMKLSKSYTRMEAIDNLEGKYRRCCNNFFSARTPYCKQINTNIKSLNHYQNSCSKNAIPHLLIPNSENPEELDMAKTFDAIQKKQQLCCYVKQKPICKKLRQLP